VAQVAERLPSKQKQGLKFKPQYRKKEKQK
jgi:hypothetical protein